MAGTSILATICAERLTKFLTRYSKAQTGNLRSSIPVASIKPNVAPPTVRVVPVERKYSLCQSVENQFQMPLLERPKPLDNLYGFIKGQGKSQQRDANSDARPRVSGLQRSQLLADFHGFDASEMLCNGRPVFCGLGQQFFDQTLTKTKARYQVLAKYANVLLNSKPQIRPIF
ncbi:uncharacterized protein LOC115764453 [Drosophila novamexicana]|uniref:uncharacterized protein LOC115764453 n=1 Tax=Drosophila novamexicana TaxID=47314 RepID=UPI0011E5CE21|nr:uncharacterized protein LOC115764453 [Drosophila novamexicana]